MASVPSQTTQPIFCICQLLGSPTTHHWGQGPAAMKGLVLRSHLCPECGKSFSKKGNLERHQGVHTTDKLFTCGECGRCFTTHSHLLTHQSTHTGEGPFCCGERGHHFHLEMCPATHQQTQPKGGPSICSKSLSTRICFNLHVQMHGEKRLFACTECGKGFVKKGTLTAHREIHKREKPFKCPECSRCFGQSATLLAHQKVHLLGGPFICTECGKSLSTKKYFNVHQRNHTKQKPLEGHTNGVALQVIQIKEEPDFAIKSEESMLENTSYEGDVDQGCSIPRNPSDPKNAPWKIQMKEEPKPPSDYTANIAAVACQKLSIKEEAPENPDYGKLPLMASQERQLKKEEGADGQHEAPRANNQVLLVKEEPQEGVEFGMHYEQKPNLSATQIKEEPGVEFNHQESQSPRRKQKKHHQPTKERRNREKSTTKKDPSAKTLPKGGRIFPCPECGKGFNQKSNLTRHRKIHTSEGPYKCSECGESFRMSRKLARHQRAHLSEPFKCPECGKSFTQRSNLVRHQRIHTKEEPFQCPECEKTFNQKANLFRHQTIHLRMGPRKCTKCGKCFPQKCHLIKHQLLHSRGGAYKCGLCGKRYRLKKYLRRHQKIHTREGAAPCSKHGEAPRSGGGGGQDTEQTELASGKSEEES